MRDVEPSFEWQDIRPFLQREASRSESKSRWEAIEHGLRAVLEGGFLPRAEKAASAAFYWGKKAAVPAVLSLLAIFCYTNFIRSPVPASQKFEVRINFGPSTEGTPESYYPDLGSPLRTTNGNVTYCWRTARKSSINLQINFGPSDDPPPDGFYTDTGKSYTPRRGWRHDKT